MKITEWLKYLSTHNGSDLYLSTGAPPCAKFDGQLRPIDSHILRPGEVREIAASLMDAHQRSLFEEELEMNLATSIPGFGRFRVNIFRQRNEVSLVCRNIVADIPRWQDLQVPEVLPQVMLRERGLVLCVGPAGSGKTSTLAALVDYRNANSGGHIVTIEDPVEFVHSHKLSIVNQREVGVDTRSWENALKNTLRQAPDVIVVSEVRDRRTLEFVLAFAETGHLCLAAMEADSVADALASMVAEFPEERRRQVLMSLGRNLQALVSQRLVPTVDGGRCAAFEVLLGTPEVADLLRRGELEQAVGAMAGSDEGMATLATSLASLCARGLVSEEDARRHADLGELPPRRQIEDEAGDDTGLQAPSASLRAIEPPPRAKVPAEQPDTPPEDDGELAPPPVFETASAMLEDSDDVGPSRRSAGREQER